MVTLIFWSLCAGMAVLALAFVLPPLLRGERATASEAAAPTANAQKRKALEQAREAGVLDAAEYRRKLAALGAQPRATQASLAPVLSLAVLLPLAAFALYDHLGEPRALDPALRAPSNVAGARLARPGGPAPAAAAASAEDSAAAPSMDQAVAGLAERMRQSPDDLEGWLLLGRAYKTMERFEPAREALSNAFRLAPDDPEVLVEYAEAMALASSTRRIGGESLMLIQRALGIDPQNQRGLWLLGVSSMQAGVPADAVTVWERLLPLLEGDARASLLSQLDSARASAGMAPREGAETVAESAPLATAPAAVAAADEAEAADGARLVVDVDIDPTLKAQIGASDVLFVYARAAEGPRMPLAIQRLSASSLPVRVVLDDSTSMMPSLKLSTMPQVVIGARISKSGQATPQSGDFETVSAPMSNRSSAPLSLRIDRVVP
jgi:cytochrome c-type biogenesis protein CcmH